MLSTEIEWNLEECFFTLLSKGWNVKKAKEILRDVPHEAFDFEVKTFSKLLAKRNGNMIVMGVGIDDSRLNSPDIDLSIPVIIVSDPITKHVLIDGWHRVAKADKLGTETLQCFVLTDEESRKILFK